MKNQEQEVSCIPLAYNADKREIYVTGDITDDLYQNFTAAFRDLDRTNGRITVFLNTGGGVMSSAFAMHDLIKLARNKVSCFCCGNCMSVGMIILNACDERYSLPSCRFMVHSVSLSETGGTLSFLKTTLKEVEYMNEAGIKLLTKTSILTEKEVRALCKDTTCMSAEQVAGYGWIDTVLAFSKKKPIKRRK
jgi:ATP-dependent Clp protease protease subunit